MDELRDVSRFICDMTFEGLPPGVSEASKLPIIDCIGVTIAGFDDPSSRIASEWVEKAGGRPVSTVLLSGSRTSAAWAALANGTAAHALDYDDVCFKMMGHPSVALVPAIMAVGEEVSASGRDCMTAYVAGLEVASKVGENLGGNPYVLGWHQTSTLGALSAAASCGKMLGLDVERMTCALGIACSLADGLRVNFGTMTKPLHAGLAAMHGVMAAQLAGMGFTANPDSLFGESGMASAFSADRHKSEMLAGALGNPYDLVDPGLSFKPYPCCRGPQGAIDAARDLHVRIKERYGGVDHSKIERVRVRVPEWLRGVLKYHRPENGTEGKFSLEYCVTAGLLEGQVAAVHFLDEAVSAPEVVRTIEKFDWQDIEGERTTSPFCAEVTVTMADGSEFTSWVERPLGEPGNPMSAEQIYDKYLGCATTWLEPETARESLEVLKRLEELGDVSELVPMLLPGERSPSERW